MATGQKISAQTVATTWSGTDQATIVQSGTNKSITHDVFMDDTQICKAWVNFNGTGVVAIRDDYNVSSITDNGTGDYTVNFTNAMSDANYAVVLSESFIPSGTANASISLNEDTPPTTTTFTLLCQSGGGLDYNPLFVCASIFGS